MYSVITTVGTSLLSNYCKDDSDNSGEKIKSFYRKKLLECTGEKSSYYIERIGEKQPQELTKWALKNYENKAAEIKSLLEIQKKLNDEIRVHLITTDTVASNLAANTIKDCLMEKIPAMEIHRIQGLQVEDSKLFQNVGISTLMTKINEIRKQDKDKWKLKESEFILNVSGGYKALIPYLTIIGQLYEMDLFYIYEDSNELIRIPVLPFNLDWIFAETVYEPMHRDHLNELVENSEVCRLLLKYSLVGNGNFRRLTGLGRVVKDYIQKEYYISRETLGHFMEYKIFEYYVKYTYKDYCCVERGFEFQANKNEFDVILSKTPISRELQRNFIVIESKLYGELEKK